MFQQTKLNKIYLMSIKVQLPDMFTSNESKKKFNGGSTNINANCVNHRENKVT